MSNDPLSRTDENNRAARPLNLSVMRLLRSAFIPVTLFIGNLLLRLSLISKGPYHLDCVTMAYQAELTLKTGSLHYLHSHGFPFSAMIAASSAWLAQAFTAYDAVAAVNGMSVFVSALCVPLFFIITKKLVDPTTAVISSLLFSVSPIFLSLSVFGNTHVLSLFLCVFSLLIVLQVKTRLRAGGLLAAGITLGLWGAARLQDFITLLPAVLVLFHLPLSPQEPPPEKSPGLRIKAVLTIAFIIIGLFYLPLTAKTPGTGLRSFWDFEIFSRLDLLSVRYLLLSLIYSADNFLPLGLVLIALGHVIIYRVNKPLIPFLTAWYAVPFLVFSRLDIVMPRFFLCALPALYILAGTALASLYRQPKGYFKTMTVLITILLAWLCFYRVYPVLDYRHRYALLPDYVRWLNDHAAPGAVMIPGDEGDFLRYYKGPGLLRLPLKIRAPYSAADLDFFKQKIDQAIANGRDVYINYITLSAHNPRGQLTDFLKKNYSLLCIGEKLYEDWHRGAMYQFIYPVAVYRIVNE